MSFQDINKIPQFSRNKSLTSKKTSEKEELNQKKPENFSDSRNKENKTHLKKIRNQKFQALPKIQYFVIQKENRKTRTKKVKESKRKEEKKADVIRQEAKELDFDVEQDLLSEGQKIEKLKVLSKIVRRYRRKVKKMKVGFCQKMEISFKNILQENVQKLSGNTFQGEVNLSFSKLIKAMKKLKSLDPNQESPNHNLIENLVFMIANEQIPLDSPIFNSINRLFNKDDKTNLETRNGSTKKSVDFQSENGNLSLHNSFFRGFEESNLFEEMYNCRRDNEMMIRDFADCSNDLKANLLSNQDFFGSLSMLDNESIINFGDKYLYIDNDNGQ